MGYRTQIQVFVEMQLPSVTLAHVGLLSNSTIELRPCSCRRAVRAGPLWMPHQTCSTPGMPSLPTSSRPLSLKQWLVLVNNGRTFILYSYPGVLGTEYVPPCSLLMTEIFALLHIFFNHSFEAVITHFPSTASENNLFSTNNSHKRNIPDKPPIFHKFVYLGFIRSKYTEQLTCIKLHFLIITHFFLDHYEYTTTKCTRL